MFNEQRIDDVSMLLKHNDVYKGVRLNKIVWHGRQHSISYNFMNRVFVENFFGGHLGKVNHPSASIAIDDKDGWEGKFAPNDLGILSSQHLSSAIPGTCIIKIRFLIFCVILGELMLIACIQASFSNTQLFVMLS